jgi:hypothetical protein
MKSPPEFFLGRFGKSMELEAVELYFERSTARPMRAASTVPTCIPFNTRHNQRFSFTLLHPFALRKYNCEQGGIIIIAHSATLKLFDPAIP